MTPKQREKFNRMRAALRRIASGYQTPEQLRRSAERDYWLDYVEALEMAYDSIQGEARCAVHGIREIKPTPTEAEESNSRGAS